MIRIRFFYGMNSALPVRLKNAYFLPCSSAKPGWKVIIFLTVQFSYRKKPKADHYIIFYFDSELVLHPSGRGAQERDSYRFTAWSTS